MRDRWAWGVESRAALGGTGLLPSPKRKRLPEAFKGLNAKGESTPGQTEPPIWVYYHVQRAEMKTPSSPWKA